MAHLPEYISLLSTLTQLFYQVGPQLYALLILPIQAGVNKKAKYLFYLWFYGLRS